MFLCYFLNIRRQELYIVVVGGWVNKEKQKKKKTRNVPIYNKTGSQELIVQLPLCVSMENYRVQIALPHCNYQSIITTELSKIIIIIKLVNLRY